MDIQRRRQSQKIDKLARLCFLCRLSNSSPCSFAVPHLSKLRGLLLWHRLMLTGGVDETEASISQWIKAGTAVDGIGSKLITAQAVKDKDYDGIAKKVSECMDWIKKTREK